MNKQVIVYSVGAVLIIAAFFSGYKYGQSQTVSGISKANLVQGAGGNFVRGQGVSDGQNNVRRAGTQGLGGMVNGEVISQDDKSVTVKMRDGSSKIVFYSSATTIGKTTEGSAADLAVGKQVNVQGTTNPDGSVTAQNIQIRPDQPVGQVIPPVNQ